MDDTTKNAQYQLTTPSTPVQVRLDARQLAELDDFRRQQPDVPSRPEALRRLTVDALAARRRDLDNASDG